MIKVLFAESFLRKFRKLENDLQEEAYEKIDSFKNKDNHKILRVHKLKGNLKDRYSFSVNYQYRIVFIYQDKNTVILLSIGDHDVYRD